jgi:hypothetical protein
MQFLMMQEGVMSLPEKALSAVIAVGQRREKGSTERVPQYFLFSGKSTSSVTSQGFNFSL